MARQEITGRPIIWRPQPRQAAFMRRREDEALYGGAAGGGKSDALFGSYGWGDGEWMRSWEKDCDDAGINLVCESVICQETPDGDTLEACRAMGRQLAE